MDSFEAGLKSRLNEAKKALEDNLFQRQFTDGSLQAIDSVRELSKKSDMKAGFALTLDDIHNKISDKFSQLEAKRLIIEGAISILEDISRSYNTHVADMDEIEKLLTEQVNLLEKTILQKEGEQHVRSKNSEGLRIAAGK